ncbi:MAG: PAS domain S-box protein [Acidobacteria bacterium]|nr:PAS domain S-box protein [Acidobacteriota bacterium]
MPDRESAWPLVFSGADRAGAAAGTRTAGPAIVWLEAGGRPRHVDPLVLAWADLVAAPPRLHPLLSRLVPDRPSRVRLVRALAAARRGARESLPALRGRGGRKLAATVLPLGSAGTALALADVGEVQDELEQVQRRARELARSVERYRWLFDTSPDLFVGIGPTGRIEDINRTAARVLGLPRERLKGRRVLALLPPETRQAVRAALPAFLESGEIEDLELRVPRPDGVALDLIINAVAVPGEDGRPAGARVVLHDMTRRNMLQRQLLQADRLAATGRLAAGVAHEINNPLQSVVVYLSLVEASLPADFAERAAWERIREGVRRIRQIVSDLLDLHRGGTEQSGWVDVNRVTEEALGLAQTPLRHHGIRVVRDLAADVPSIRSVGRHVYQVVLNLVLNAMEAMPHGGTLTVRTRYPPGAGEVEIDVGDTGPGIPDKLLPHIFDPFLTGSPHAGTGLGLFLTYGLVREHGGRIRVDSTPGRGTTFRVLFPVEERGGD